MTAAFPAIFLLSSLATCVEAADARTWAERMAASEMKRQGDSLFFGKNPKAKWAYETGVFLKGLESIWAETGNPQYFDYIKAVMDSYVEADGSIETYKIEDFTLDNINCGKLLLTLYQRTKEEKYRKAAFVLMNQLENQPRTHEGGFWHKKIYPYQMWLD
jgi:unsaturated rhamnogalacturonyl hydrolase